MLVKNKLDCVHCGNSQFNLFEKEFSNKTRHVAAHCTACGKQRCYVAQNASESEENQWGFEPGEYVFGYGKFKEKTIKEIYQLQPDYLLWVINNFKQNKVRGIVLDFLKSRGDIPNEHSSTKEPVSRPVSKSS